MSNVDERSAKSVLRGWSFWKSRPEFDVSLGDSTFSDQVDTTHRTRNENHYHSRRGARVTHATESRRQSGSKIPLHGGYEMGGNGDAQHVTIDQLLCAKMKPKAVTNVAVAMLYKDIPLRKMGEILKVNHTTLASQIKRATALVETLL